MIKPANERKSLNVLNKIVKNSIRTVGSASKDFSFCSRWSRWCPFLVMTSVLRSHFRVSSKIVPRYLYEWTISTFSSCISIALSVCLRHLISAVICLVWFTFSSRYDSSHHSVKSSHHSVKSSHHSVKSSHHSIKSLRAAP